MRPATERNHGVTLIEILVAGVLMLTVIGLFWNVFINTSQTDKRSQEDQEYEHELMRLEIRLRRDLRSTRSISVPGDASWTFALHHLLASGDIQTEHVTWELDPDNHRITRRKGREVTTYDFARFHREDPLVFKLLY